MRTWITSNLNTPSNYYYYYYYVRRLELIGYSHSIYRIRLASPTPDLNLIEDVWSLYINIDLW